MDTRTKQSIWLSDLSETARSPESDSLLMWTHPSRCRWDSGSICWACECCEAPGPRVTAGDPADVSLMSRPRADHWAGGRGEPRGCSPGDPGPGVTVSWSVDSNQHPRVGNLSGSTLHELLSGFMNIGLTPSLCWSHFSRLFYDLTSLVIIWSGHKKYRHVSSNFLLVSLWLPRPNWVRRAQVWFGETGSIQSCRNFQLTKTEIRIQKAGMESTSQSRTLSMSIVYVSSIYLKDTGQNKT